MRVKASRPPKQESVYREIRARIQRGMYGPGYRLVIDQLARDFAVSAIPVREAVRRLEAERLVAHTPHVGFQVVAQNPRAIADTIELLAVLEGYAARVAAPAHTAETLAGLRVLLRAMMARVEAGDPLGYGALDRQFHEALVAPGGNSYVKHLLADGRDRLETLEGSLFARIPARIKSSVQEHYQLVETLAEHGPAPVYELQVRDHVLATLDALEFRAEGAHARQPNSGRAVQ